MSKVIQRLVLVLATTLPFLALFSVYSVNVLHLPVWTVFWKESLEAVIILLCLGEVFWTLRQSSNQPLVSEITIPVYLLVAATLWSLVSSFGFNNLALKVYLIGFRFELLWVWFLISIYIWIKIVKPDLHILKRYLTKCVLLSFSLVCLFSLVNLGFGQSSVLSELGFGQIKSQSNSIISDNCHIISIRAGCSLAGTFGNPNHFASYLILILPFIVSFTYEQSKTNWRMKVLGVLHLGLWLVGLGLSLARFAWVGLIFGGLIGTGMQFTDQGIDFYTKTATRKNQILKISQIIVWFLACFVGIVTLSNLFFSIPNADLSKVPAFIGKPSSSAGHSKAIMSGINILQENHWQVLTGYGLGASGPAAKAEYYNILASKLITENSYIASKWGIPNTRLTIPESWYIQIILNGGIFYFLLYILLIMWPIIYLLVYSKSAGFKVQNIYKIEFRILITCFLAIVLGNLYLHLWENHTVAIYYTILLIFGYLKYDEQTQIQ